MLHMLLTWVPLIHYTYSDTLKGYNIKINLEKPGYYTLLVRRIKALFLLFSEVTPLSIKRELKCVLACGLVDTVYH